MKCLKCSTDNPETRKFCRECGERLLLKCPKCNSENLPGDKFCGECGCDLSRLTEARPIEYLEPQSYTPKFLADKILTNRSSIEGERKLVTVLFADVANYTDMAEKLDPEEVHQIMDSFFKILMDEIHKYEGTINQFTGDGVMALFGAPVSHEDHAQRACHAALALQRAIGRFAEKIEKDYKTDFKIRIGLNSGPVIVGAIGDDLRMDYTAIGDTTNLASRMENMARPGAVLVSTNTYKLARNFFVFKSVGKIPVKGKEQLQEAYGLIKTTEIKTRIEAAAARGLTKFVGRRPEMQVLKTALEKAKSGSGQVVGIVGEAGVGKSRILLELRNMSSDTETNYLEGRCLHFGGAMAYLPILDILRSYFKIKEGEREFVIKKNIKEKVLKLNKKLQSTLPPFQDLLSLKVEDTAYLKLEPQQKRERIFEALRDLFIRISHEKPLVLAVEDLHWIDKTTEEFLNYLIDWLAKARILLILLYRPEYTHAWGSKSYYNKIGIDQLSAGTSAELVQSILEGGEVVPELRELILTKTGGNPLFMEEFTHSLLENGTIRKKDHQYMLATRASDIHIPDTIEGIIAARIDRLEDNLKRTMQVASVIGRDFAFRILQTITGMKEELKSHLINLQGLEFIYERQLFPELEYIFKHILTQEVAYNSLLARRRKEIHENIGKAIEEIYVERLEEFYEMLAYHYSKSENLERAAHYLKLSGIKAMAKHSPWEAFGHYQEALNLLKQLPESEHNKKAQIEACRLTFAPAIVLGCPEGSLQIFQAGEKLSEEIEDTEALAIFNALIGRYYSTRGNSLVAIEYGEKGFTLAEKTHKVEIIASTAVDLCTFYLFTGQYLKIVEKFPSVLDMLEKTNQQHEFFGRANSTYASLCGLKGYSMAGLGYIEQGQVYCEKGLRVATEINHIGSLGLAELYYGLLFGLKGDGKLAIEHYQKSIKYGEEAKVLYQLGWAWSGLGFGYYLLRDSETARKYIEKGIKIQQSIGLQTVLSWHYWLLSMAYFDLNFVEKAQRLIKESLKFAQKNNEINFEGLSRIWLGRILVKADLSKSDEAENSILQGIRILEELKLKAIYSDGYLALGELYTDMGRKEKALENLKKAEAMFKEMGMDYYLVKTQEVLDRL